MPTDDEGAGRASHNQIPKHPFSESKNGIAFFPDSIIETEPTLGSKLAKPISVCLDKICAAIVNMLDSP